MTYTLVNLVFLAVAAGMLVAAIRVSRGSSGVSRAVSNRDTSHLSALALLVTAVLLVVLTLVFNNLMIAAGFVDYGHAQTSGIRIGVMPVEDLAYTVFAVLALPALWTILSRTGRAGETGRASGQKRVSKPGRVRAPEAGGSARSRSGTRVPDLGTGAAPRPLTEPRGTHRARGAQCVLRASHLRRRP